MFFYEVGYSSWEECPIEVVCHSKEFTQDEFNEMVVNCYVKASNKQKATWDEHEKAYPSTRNNGKSYTTFYHPRVDNLDRDVVVFLNEDYGFTLPIISARFIVTGTEDICPRNPLDDFHSNDEFRETSDPQLLMLRERFNVIEQRDEKINNIINE
jgi:hypothetical protein